MFTDMVGYTAQTQLAEAATLRLLREQERLVRAILSTYHGKEIKSTGDGFLIEFESALQAAQCAVEIQHRIRERNTLNAASILELRIGVHLGDVEQHGDDIFGDAVNIAARIQPLAEPGGICLSGAVFEQVRNKLEHPCQELPGVHLKNVQTSVPIYRVVLPWTSQGPAHLTPWMDREAELDSLGRAFRDLLQGNGGLTHVTGEAGIGKTRLIEEGIRRAGGSELRVLRARGVRGESSPPFSFWTEAAREFLRDAPPTLVYKVCGAQPGDIVKLVPELAERLGNPPELPSLDPDQERVRFYEGIVQLFVNISKEFPLALFFDDLQWADAASLRLLRYAAPRVERVRILLLLSYRAPESDVDGGLRAAVDDLRRVRRGPVLLLKRFGADDVARVVSRLVPDISDSGDLARAIHAKTGGNPFFVEEVVRSLLERGALTKPQGSDGGLPEEWNLPETVREVVGQRLHRLTPTTLEVLGTTSVIGEEFRFQTACDVLDRDEPVVLSAIEEAVRAGILNERRDSAGGIVLAFADELIRETLIDELSLLRRQRLHLRVARAIEAAEGERTPEEVVQLEQHYLHANALEKVAPYALRAADHASKLNSPEEVVRHLFVALRTSSGKAPTVSRADLLRRLGSEEDRLARPDDALKHFAEATTLYRAEGRILEAGETLRQSSEVYLYLGGSREHALEMLENARTVLSSVPESVELSEVLADLAAFYWMGGDLEQCRKLTEETVGLTARLPSPIVRAKALRILGTLVRSSEGAGKSFEYLRQALELAELHAITTLVFDATVDIAVAYGWGTGELEQALTWMRRAVDVGIRTRNPALEMQARGCVLPYSLIACGEPDRAEREGLAAEGFYLQHQLPLDPRIPLWLGQAALTRGDLVLAESRLAQAGKLLETYSFWPVAAVYHLLNGQLLQELGNRAASLQELRRAVRTFEATGNLAWMAGSQAMALDALGAALLEEGGGAESLAEARTARSQLSELAGQMRQDFIRAYELRLGARFARVEKRFTDATVALEESARIWKRLGWRHEFARARQALGELWLDQGSVPPATACLTEALEVFTQMKAARDVERVRALDRSTKG